MNLNDFKERVEEVLKEKFDIKSEEFKKGRLVAAAFEMTKAANYFGEIAGSVLEEEISDSDINKRKVDLVFTTVFKQLAIFSIIFDIDLQSSLMFAFTPQVDENKKQISDLLEMLKAMTR